MNIRAVRYFLEIVNCGGFSPAARTLHRSQPALSRAIQELETELGMKLFDRLGRQVVLTAQGHSFAERARHLIEEVDKTLDHAKRLASGKTEILRVGAGATNIERIMPELMIRYGQTRPNVEILLRSDGGVPLLESLERGDIDVAITGYMRSEYIEAKVAFPTHLVAVIHRDHRLAATDSLTIADLDGERLLIPLPRFSSRILIDHALRQEHLSPRLILESEDLNTLVALARAGQGIAVVPSTVRFDQSATKIVPMYHRGQLIGSWTALVWDRRRPVFGHTKDFIDSAIEHLSTQYPGSELVLPRLPDNIGRLAQLG